MEYDHLDNHFEALEIRAELVRRKMMRATGEQVAALWRQLDLSLIYHDWALEGQVVTPKELEMAFDARDIFDTSSLPLVQSIRAHQEALDLSRATSQQPKLNFDLALFRQFHQKFTAKPDVGKGNIYRKEIPLHRTYFHEIAEPSHIETEMKKLVQWLNNPVVERDLENHPVIFVTKVHQRFMSIVPFVDTSGKVGRTLMNMVLMHHGYLPAVIHATERQHYYESLRAGRPGLSELIIASLNSSLDAADRFLR